MPAATDRHVLFEELQAGLQIVLAALQAVGLDRTWPHLAGTPGSAAFRCAERFLEPAPRPTRARAEGAPETYLDRFLAHVLPRFEAARAAAWKGKGKSVPSPYAPGTFFHKIIAPIGALIGHEEGSIESLRKLRAPFHRSRIQENQSAWSGA